MARMEGHVKVSRRVHEDAAPQKLQPHSRGTSARRHIIRHSCRSACDVGAFNQAGPLRCDSKGAWLGQLPGLQSAGYELAQPPKLATCTFLLVYLLSPHTYTPLIALVATPHCLHTPPEYRHHERSRRSQAPLHDWWHQGLPHPAGRGVRPHPHGPSDALAANGPYEFALLEPQQHNTAERDARGRFLPTPQPTTRA